MIISYHNRIHYIGINNAINYPKFKKKVKMKIDDDFSYPHIVIIL